MVFDTSTDDVDLVGVDVLELELLEDVGVEVANVVLQSVDGHTETLDTESGLQQVVRNFLTSGEVFSQFVGPLGLVHSDISRSSRSWFKSAISHHVEDINDIVLEAMSLEVSTFLIIIHFEVTTRHLDHTVVDGFVGVKEGLVISVLNRKERSGSFRGFVSGTDVKEDTQIDDVGENLAFSQNLNSIAQGGDFVSGFLVSDFSDLVALEGSGWVEGGSEIVGISFILEIEEVKDLLFVVAESLFGT
mmetsp:Transcript_24358/g.21510  ORF Transcript_24358/g.21510 Transcript_24358/m.21510 type:complete len:246 (-) Transcript_24358:115-852(-)